MLRILVGQPRVSRDLQDHGRMVFGALGDIHRLLSEAIVKVFATQ